MFSRRKQKLLEEAVALSKRLDIYDRDSLADYVVDRIYEYVMKEKAKKVDDIIEGVLRTCREVAWLGGACLHCRLIEVMYEQAEDYGIDDIKYFRKALLLARRRLELALAGQEDQYVGVLDTNILHGTTLLIMSFTEFTRKAASTLRYKLNRILVPMRSPLNTGVGFAGTLKKMGLPVFYIPDEPLAWAVDTSNYILADAAGSAYGGRLIVDVGVVAAAQLAASRSTETLIVVKKQASCEAREVNIGERVPYIVLESTAGGPPVKAKLLDVLDPKETPVKIVTENDILDGSREHVRERQRVIEEVIDDIVTYILNQPL